MTDASKSKKAEVMDSYLDSVRKQFAYYKGLCEKAMAQVPDEGLFWQYNAESNSIAIVVNHMAGNMLSRFTEFLTTDGEKEWRNRDQEFAGLFQTREALFEQWNKGWRCLTTVLEDLTQEELEKMVYIRNEGHTVTEAINRQLAHYAYHSGQIVFIAKMIKNGEWQSLSIPRNRSREYNAGKFSEEKGKRHFTDNED